MQSILPAPIVIAAGATSSKGGSTTQQKDVLHHVAIAVKDIKQAVEWYQSTFNCSVDYQDETWALLGFQNVQLALVVPNQHPPHICVARDDAERFGTLKPHRDGTSSVYVRDPAGNAVEVLKQQS
jgi:catechol 2,3-dioxygenase-like lactoylglutathione lyase family enzyme